MSYQARDWHKATVGELKNFPPAGPEPRAAAHQARLNILPCPNPGHVVFPRTVSIGNAYLLKFQCGHSEGVDQLDNDIAASLMASVETALLQLSV